MPIIVVVQSAETLTFLLTIALCIRIFTLYRASVPQNRPPMSEPIALPKPAPAPSMAPPEVLESYIDELLGTSPLPEPYMDRDAPPPPAPEKALRVHRDPVPEQDSQPFEPEACQSIAHFLLSRRYDAESV